MKSLLYYTFHIKNFDCNELSQSLQTCLVEIGDDIDLI